MSIRTLIMFTAFILLANVQSPLADVVSDFSSGSEGWLIIGDNAGEWDPTGGNPGGALSINDLATGQVNIASAPSKFLGNWYAVYNGVLDSISFDVWFVNTSGGALLTGPWIIQIAGPRGKHGASFPVRRPRN